MAQHDYVLDNATGAAFRSDLNNVLAAIASNNSGATEPSTTYAYQFWLDTSLSPARLKIRNSANSAWEELGEYGRAQDLPYDNSTSGLAASNVKAALDELSENPRKNSLINGGMKVSQRGDSFTSATTYPNDDDAYTLDRWLLLSDGNNIVDVSRNTSETPTNGFASCALDVETANKKFGIAQILEQKDCVGLIGESVTLSFKAKVSSVTNLDNVKAAIVAWSGTADTVTSDMVSTWNAEDTNPTLVANWTFENTPADLSVTTSWATYEITADIDTASTKNIAVLIWSDVTTTSVGEFLYIADVQLEKGSASSPFENRSIALDTAMCQRYFESWQPVSTSDILTVISARSTSTASGAFNFSSKKRVSPTVSSNGSSWTLFGISGETFSSFSFVANTVNVAVTWNDSGTPFATKEAYGIAVTTTAGHGIDFDAEM